MSPEFKKKWVEALRSGDYKQGRGYLCNARTIEFCCLGVACELIDKNVIRKELDGTVVKYRLDCESVFSKASMTMLSPELLDFVGLYRPHAADLAAMNDTGTSFAEIADYIQEKL
jgi:hypothetical protein